MKPLREIGESILKALTDPDLFARQFQPAESWLPWLTVIRVIFGVPLTAAELVRFREATGRSRAFDGPLGEAWLLCGRRSGKSRILALIAVCLATFRDYTPFLAPGERGVAMVLAVDKDQAAVIFGYAKALIEQTPMLAAMVTNVTADTLDLDNGVSIEVHTSSYKSVRGRTLVAALCDEAAFWRSEDSRNPAAAVLAALRPGLSTIPGAPLLVATSTYSQEGAVYEAFTRHHGQDDSTVMVWRAPTLTMNPSFRRDVVTAALAADPQSAAAEYGSEFLTDLRAYLDEELIQDSIDHGCHERAPSNRWRYVAFVDPSGGRRDSFTAAIAHRAGEQLILDAVREYRPPLDPAVVVEDIAKTLKGYRISKVIGDAYAGEWPVSVFRSQGISYQTSEANRSDIYLETGPLLAQGRARLIDMARLTTQLRQLERRSAPSGRDRVDHGPGGHDDVANSALGAIYLAAQAKALPAGFDPARHRPEYSLM
jgi:terminase large subunit-like protein